METEKHNAHNDAPCSIVAMVFLQSHFICPLSLFKSKKIARACKPGSVTLAGFLSSIWGRRRRRSLSTYPPTTALRLFGRASPRHLPVYLVFQPMRLAIAPVAGTCRGLLPRVFTLALAGGFFSVALAVGSPLAGKTAFPLGSMVARAARTFLSPSLASDRTALAIFFLSFFGCKDTHIF